MAESLAIISGKGGSGKTTLAISLAQLLSSCGKRVLLVDCDMSTHGATYFFESMLSNKNRYFTVIGLLFDNSNSINDGMEFLNVSDNVWFLPSCVNFPSKSIPFSKAEKFRWYTFNDDIIKKKEFDVVIYDCQAGYSMITEMVTKKTNKNLAVIEADAISASSLRVLYAQLSENLDRGNTYQIFNKITQEEQDVYTKLIHGTLFTNLSPILFDWNVRKAFITNELPEINASNPILTNSVYNLAFDLFPNYKNEMREFLVKIKEDIISRLENEVYDVKRGMRGNLMEVFFKTIPVVMSIIGVFLAIFIYYFDGYYESYFSDTMLTILYCTLITLSFSSFAALMSRKSKHSDEIRQLRKRRQNLEDEIKNIMKKIQK